MKAIRTITINPCFDLHYTVPDFQAEKENLVTKAEVEAGGKGINTSRALTVCGVENVAYLIVGDENGAAFLAQMEKDRIPCEVFTVPGRIRENITVHPGQGKETRISVNSFCITEEVFGKLEAKLLAEPLPDLLISFSGRIPNGVSKDRVKAFLRGLIAGGAKLVIDSSSLTPDDLTELHPWLIKPNEQEIEAFLGVPVKSSGEAAKAAKGLVLSGVSETVMISLGGDGAVWSDGKTTYRISVPKLEHPASTIGAGDSTVAGLLAGVRNGYSTEDTLRLAVSYGTAACMTAGTLPPKPEDVRRVYEETKAERI